MTPGKVDVVVVGSGAGGGVVAKELAEAGLSVVVFERGKAYTTADFDHSETESQYSTPPAYGPRCFLIPAPSVTPTGKRPGLCMPEWMAFTEERPPR